MKDVRRLTKTVLWLGIISLGLGIAVPILLLCFKKRDAFRTFCAAFLIILGVLVVVMIALGIWASVDFDSFWAAFHVVFLDLESSTFDPAQSRMIRICPPELFADFIGRFAVYSAVLVGIAAVACAVYLVVTRKKHA